MTEAGRTVSGADRDEKQILDEFTQVTGFHQQAIRVLGQKAKAGAATRIRSRLYDEAVVQALTILLEAADGIYGKRLQPAFRIGGSAGAPWTFGSGARGSRES